jgi:thiamine-monophosphate kinase
VTGSPSTPTVASLGERALIDRIRVLVGPPPPHVVIGIGHDAAVLRPDRGALTVLSTDSLIEDVHFRRAWTPPDAIGGKALAVNLSDLAATGATPRAALLSLALPPALPLSDFDEMIRGFLAAARVARVALIGGNISSSPGPLVIDTTVLGSGHPRKRLTRAGAKPGDELYLTGCVGGAAAGLAWLAAGRDAASATDEMRGAVERYARPEARWRCGSIVARTRSASAAIDLSDGLAEAARQLAEASGVGLELDASAIPVDPGMRFWAGQIGTDTLEAAVTGGEDYELLFAVPPRRRSRFLAAMRRCRDVPVTRVGIVSRPDAGEATWQRNGIVTPLPAGFRHLGG